MQEHRQGTPLVEHLRGFISAVRLVTVLPVPGSEAASITSSQPWFPVVGAILGGLTILIGASVMRATGAPEFAALAAVVAGAGLTRCLHLDGLCDWADGFWGGFTPERRLEIMKDSRIGTFGAVALVSFLLAKWIALTRIADAGDWTWVWVAYILSRTMQVLLACLQPYARAGEGTGRDFVQNAQVGRTTLALAVCIVLIALTGNSITGLLSAAGGALLLTVLFGAWCRRSVGGVTGDLIGACSEFVETWVLLCGGIFVA